MNHPANCRRLSDRREEGMIEIDDRLSSIAGIDKTRAALVSATSLMTMARVLEDNQIPNDDLEKLLLEPYGMVLANIIQTLVVHETVYADSILFDRNNDLNWAETKFPGIVRRLFVPPTMRAEIAETMNSISQTAPDFYEIDVSGDDRLMKILLDRQTAAEKPLLDALHDERQTVLRVPADTVITTDMVAAADLWTKMGIELPDDVLVSMNTGARAFYYFELAQRTGLPLAVDPPRSKYLVGLLEDVGAALASDTPGMLLDMFDKTIVSQDRLDSWRKEGLRRTEVRIPPVAEYVIRTARRRQQGLCEALTDIRMSKPAREFRDMCAQLRALRDDGSTAALLARDKMIVELKQLGQKWAENCGPITDYRVREINIAELIAGIFEAIPLLGAVGKGIKAALTSTHFDKVRLTPKFFWKRPALKCELFLSDLYAAPSKL
jgi:hypothetical protein